MRTPPRTVVASLLGVALLGALAAGCSELPCDIEVEGGARELRVGQELRARVTWDGKRADQVKRFKQARFVWTSDRDGRLGEGPELRTSALSQGIHELVAEVWLDGEHDGYLDGVIAITVSRGQPPRVRILAPTTEVVARVPAGQPVRLVGDAFDPEDGALAGASLTWTVEGTRRGQGGELVLQDLVAGRSYEVALFARDAAGDEGRARLWLHVEQGGAPAAAAPASPGPPAPSSAAPGAGFAGALGQ